jgi:predicted homoserine dehydrogenase-like protein
MRTSPATLGPAYPGPRTGLWRRLEGRTAEPIRVGVLGTGFVGAGVLRQLRRVPGLVPAAVAARDLEAGRHALLAAGIPSQDIVVAIDPTRAEDSMERGETVLTQSPEMLAELACVDVVVEATGSLDTAAEFMLSALAAGIDVVSMNAEVDATIGWLLHTVAARHNVVYTIADGDQPGVLLRQIGMVAGMGFGITAALNCKRHLDIHQSPGDSDGYAARDSTSLRMTTAFGDGTKMNVENAVVANLTGLTPDRRGMHGVPTTVADAVDDVLAVISRRGVVDYTLGGDFAAGVAVIGHAADADWDGPYLRYFKMGAGPDHLFFRPYHLVHYEVPVTIAEVALDRLALGVPAGPPIAEVVAIAKRDLQPGDRVDGIGGALCYGQIDTVTGAAGALPIGLSHLATVTRAVRRDDVVTFDDVELIDAPILTRRGQQDALLASDRPDAADHAGRVA